MSSESETTDLRPQLPLAALLQRLMWSRGWDLAMPRIGPTCNTISQC